MPDFLSELKWRNLFAQCTDEAGLLAHLASGSRKGYVGYDPTADSLTIGNLVTIMLLAHLQRAGHSPVVIAGGGTGLIGDPSGKSAERTMMTPEIVAANVEAQMRIFGRLLDYSAAVSNRAVTLNNADWLCSISYLDALRDIGKFFSVNMMMQKDSVRDRLTNRDQGISYTEFSYMILQSYDFAHLFEKHGVTLQMGGADQWGNIVGGLDLIRRRQAAANVSSPDPTSQPAAGAAFGLTAPLVTKADGGKFGKTETGAIWLTADRTSPYAYYQFWLNAADSDVSKFLRIFTLLRRDTVEAAVAAHEADPGKRDGHRLLASAATELLHGRTEAVQAEAASKALFSGELSGLSGPMLQEVFAAVPRSDHSKALLEGAGVRILDMLTQTGLAASGREAKEFLNSGSVTVNGRKTGLEDRLTMTDLLEGGVIAIRRGKKNWHLTRWA